MHDDMIGLEKKGNINTSKLMWSIYAIIFSTILIPDIRIQGLPSFRVDQIITIIIVIYYFMKVAIIGKVKIKKDLFLFLYSGFSFFIILSILIGSYKGIKIIPNDFFELYKIFNYIIVYWVTSSIVKNDNDKFKIIKFTIFCLLLSVLVAVQQYFNLFNLNEKYVPIIAPTQFRTLVNNYSSPRVVGMTSNPNVYAVMPGMGGVLSWSMYSITSNKKYILQLVIFTLAVFMTLSRTGMVFLVVSVFTFSLLYFYKNVITKNIKKVLKIVALIITVVLLSSIIFNYLPEELTWRFKLGLNISADNSFQTRVSNWEEHVKYFLKSPWFGLGPAKSIVYEHSVDNEWLLLLRQYGVIGTFYFVMTFLSSFILKKRSYFKYLYLSILIGSIVYMFPAIIYHSFQIMPLIMVIAGLVTNDESNLNKEVN